MGGGNAQKNKPPSSSSASQSQSQSQSQSHHHRKSHRSPPRQPPNTKPSPSSKHKPSPKPNPNPNPNPIPSNFAPPPQLPLPPPPPPSYGFHMLDRKTIVLADGSVRSYLALPPDYQDFPPIRPHAPDSWLGDRQQNQDYWNSLGVEASRKRKFVGDDEFARQRQQLLQYGSNSNSNGAGPSTRIHRDEMRPDKLNDIVDQAKFKTAFFNFIKVIFENANQKKNYLADGKQGSLPCLACTRSSKDFPDMHSLIMHTYNPEKATSPEQVPDHLGLHKALCILMGWNYLMPPDNSKTYQRLSPEDAAADRDDLIMWPPHVIIQNTATGKGRDGRMEGLGNKAMDMKLRDFGFTSGKSKSMYGREGHMGTTAVKFVGDHLGLKDALKLADFFEKQKHGRRSWVSVQSKLRAGADKEKDPNFVKIDNKTGEKERILYGYLGTVFDLDGVDFETRKKVTIESRRERSQHQHQHT